MKRELARTGAVAFVLLVLLIGDARLHAVDRTPSVAGTSWQVTRADWTPTFHFRTSGALERKEETWRRESGKWSQRGETIVFDYRIRSIKSPDHIIHYHFNGKLTGNQISGTLTHTVTDRSGRSGPYAHKTVFTPVSKWPP